jgi:agmatinase
MTYDSLPFSGIATFFKAPLVERPTAADADVAVVGIGWDEGTTSRSGARMGPRALREASTMYAFQRDAEPFWDGEAGVELLGGIRWADTGDVALGPMWSPERYHNAVVDRLQPIMESGLFLVTLGGDHSIGYPVLKALHQSRGGKPVHLVQFDTHMDYWDEEGGSRFSHASPIIRSHEAGFIHGLTQYGIRSLHTPGDNIALAKSRGAHIFWAQQAKDMRVEDLTEHLPKGGDVYITFDIDALDPAIAPGTGTPEPGGFTYYEAKDILLSVCERCNVVGMDLVEVAPQYDGPGQLTALHGARLILDTVGAVFRRRASLP